MKTLEDLEKEMYHIASKLGISSPDYESLIIVPTENPKTSLGRWYEMGDGVYLEHWTEERSTKRHKIVIKDEDEFLYLKTREIIDHMARKWERDNRRPGSDFQSLYFPRVFELFGLVNKEWQQRASEELQ